MRHSHLARVLTTVWLVANLTGGPDSTSAQRAETLSLTFIANAAVQVTDGRHTLISDFPYESGYSRYMTYDRSRVRPFGEVLLLITHEHRDHFLATAVRGPGWRVIGPDAVQRQIPEADRAGPEAAAAWGISVRPVPTPHVAGHRSYRVDWHGRSIYFTGDTEDASALLAERQLDVAFVTPWLWRQVRAAGRVIDATQVVIYHHEATESVGDCLGACQVPAQGWELRLPLRRRW